MRKVFTVAGALLAAMTVTVLSAGPALAATYTVEADGISDGSDVIVSASAANIDFSTPQVQMGCNSSTSDKDTDVHTGSVGDPPDPIATIHNTDWTGCDGPLGLPMDVEHVGDWELHVTDSSTVTSGDSDVIEGEVSNVEAIVSQSSDPSACKFTVEGHASGTFDEATQTLHIDETGYTGHLEVTDMWGTGCYNLVLQGDPADFAGDFDITVDGNPAGVYVE